MDKINSYLFLITDLGVGGAEQVLYRICKYSHTHKFTVVSLGSQKYFYEKLQALPHVTCVSLNLSKTPSPSALLRALREFHIVIQSTRPAVISAFMYHAEFFACLYKIIYASKIPLVWNIRNSTLSLRQSSKSSLVIIPFLSFFSYFLPRAIVSCAQSAAQLHIKLLYSKRKISVIHNGIDTTDYSPLAPNIEDPHRKFQVLIVARYTPQKDLTTAFKALYLLHYHYKVDLRITMVGNNLDSSNISLIDLLVHYKLDHLTTLLGRRSDLPTIYQTHDVTLLTSCFGEACPNVLIESIACGTPVVSTDVGDSRIITNKYGFIVPIKSPKATAMALKKAFSFKMPSDHKIYIKSNFSIDSMLHQHLFVLHNASI